MIMVDTMEEIKTLINENEMVLLYFGSESCGVCTAVKPKVEEILKAYPKIKNIQVDSERSLIVSAAFNVFTIPVIILYVEGKEIIREARHISMGDLSSKIERYYTLFYE